MKASGITGKTRSGVYETEDGNVNYVFRPGTITPAWLDDLIDKYANGDSGEGRVDLMSAELLSVALVSWDLEADDGSEYPHDFDSLKALPAEFLVGFTDALRQKETPGEEKKGSFAAG